MNSDQIQSKIDANLDELSKIMSMAESEACLTYNVDFKQEIIDLINEEIKILNDVLGEIESDDELNEWHDECERLRAEYEKYQRDLLTEIFR